MVSACAGDSGTHEEVTALFEELVPPDGYTAGEISIVDPDHDPFTRQLGHVTVSWHNSDPGPSLKTVTADVHEYFTSYGFKLVFSGGRTATECSNELTTVSYMNDQLAVSVSYSAGNDGPSIRTLWNDDWIDGRDSSYTVVTELPVCGDDAPGWRS